MGPGEVWSSSAKRVQTHDQRWQHDVWVDPAAVGNLILWFARVVIGHSRPLPRAGSTLQSYPSPGLVPQAVALTSFALLCSSLIDVKSCSKLLMDGAKAVEAAFKLSLNSFLEGCRVVRLWQNKLGWEILLTRSAFQSNNPDV